jgi:glycosyltransferase involved in cell wall biosynthesis
MNSDPLISIILPTFNRQHTLKKAIDSIIKQTYTTWELIVVDDGSIDNTKDLIEDYTKKDFRIKYIKNSHKKGPAGARNCALGISKGEYIAFLDSDDEWLDFHLFDSINALKNHNVNICFSLWYEKDCNGTLFKLYDSDREKEFFNNAIDVLKPKINGNIFIFGKNFYEYTVLNTFLIYHINSTLIKKDILTYTGYFDEELLASEDTDFILRIISAFKFCFIFNYHFIYNQGEDNIYWFIDRSKIDINELFDDSKTINKLNFCGIYKCLMFEKRKNFIKKLNNLNNKQLCLEVCNKRISTKYFTLAFINKKQRKLKSLFFLLKSLLYKFKLKSLLFAFNIIFPNFWKKPTIDISELYFY